LGYGDDLRAALVFLAFNLWALCLVGPELERWLGRARYLGVYLLSAIGGTLFDYYLAPGIPYWQLSERAAGASAAVFGLFGAWIVLSQRERLSRRAVMALIAVYLVFSFAVPHIGGWLAAASPVQLPDLVGGVATGGLLAAVYASARTMRGSRRAFQLGATGAVLVALMVAAIF
jgi:membrane associated rhomboid family serine protease